MVEHQLTGLDDLRAELEASGWRAYHDGLRREGNACNWYACKPCDSTLPDCPCNDKPPQFVAHPWDMSVLAGVVAQSVELSITGETPDGLWLNLKAYSIQAADFIRVFPAAGRRLAAAWTAAAQA